MGMPDFPPIVGTLAAVNDVVAMEVTEAAMVSLSLKGGGSGVTGLNLAFEISTDSTNGIDGSWHQVTAARTNANTSEIASGVIAVGANAALAYAWEIGVVGFNWIRAKVTAVVSGSATGRFTASRYAIDPAPVVAAHPVTNTPATPTTNSGLTVATGPAGVLITGSPTTVFAITLANPTDTAMCLKLYNKATAPNVGSDVPVHTVNLGAFETLQSIQLGALGMRFGTGLGIAFTKLIAASDATAVTAGAQWTITRV